MNHRNLSMPVLHQELRKGSDAHDVGRFPNTQWIVGDGDDDDDDFNDDSCYDDSGDADCDIKLLRNYPLGEKTRSYVLTQGRRPSIYEDLLMHYT